MRWVCERTLVYSLNWDRDLTDGGAKGWKESTGRTLERIPRIWESIWSSGRMHRRHINCWDSLHRCANRDNPKSKEFCLQACQSFCANFLRRLSIWSGPPDSDKWGSAQTDSPFLLSLGSFWLQDSLQLKLLSEGLLQFLVCFGSFGCAFEDCRGSISASGTPKHG